MRRSDNYSTEKTITQYLKYSLETRVKAGIALDEGNLEKFKKHLSLLHREYFAKFNRRTDVERPDFAETKMLGIKQPRPVKEMNIEQMKALYTQIQVLQEKLGHTSITSQEMSKKENKGGKKLADEIEEANNQ